MSQPRLPLNRTLEREGLRAAEAYFESRSHVFQEVSLQNDFGKDVYLDVTRDGALTPMCIALQVKSGLSYRRRGGYAIPVGSHGILWRDSTIPTFGLVYDPSSRLLFWTDLTRELAGRGTLPTHVAVSPDNRLDTAAGEGAFYEAIARHATEPNRDLASRLLNADSAIQYDAVGDAWALGRRSAHALLLLRRVVADLDWDATRHAIYRLSHAGSNPDIFWHQENWIPASIRERVAASFQFSVLELVHLFACVDFEEWERGGLGQALYSIVLFDKHVTDTAPAAIAQLMFRQDVDSARCLLGCAVALSERPKALIERMRRAHPVLRDDMVVRAWLDELGACGCISPY